jgi:hypothetical protein
VRLPAYESYAEAWRRAAGLARRPRAGEMDARLHAERVDPRTRRQRTYPLPARLPGPRHSPVTAGGLPDGVMVRRDGACGLLAGGRFLPWSFTGQRARP